MKQKRTTDTKAACLVFSKECGSFLSSFFFLLCSHFNARHKTNNI